MSHANGTTNGQQFTEQQTERFLTAEPLAGYTPNLPIFSLFGDDTRPRYQEVLRDVEAMLTHPRVAICNAYLKAGIAGMEIEVRASSSKIEEFVATEWDRFFTRSRRQAQYSYDFGRLGMGARYCTEGALLRFDSAVPLHPLDCVVLTRARQYVGFRVRAAGTEKPIMDLRGPNGFRPGSPAHGLWLVHNQRFWPWYGWTQLYGAHRPWKRLATRDGAEEIIDGGVYRYAYAGPIVRFPQEDHKRGANSAPGADPESGRQKAREIHEGVKAGAGIALSSVKYSSEQGGDYKWSVEWPQHVLDVAPLLTYAGDLEKQISLGIGVPSELLEASEVGSGYSGRAIPLEGFLTARQDDADELARAWKEQIGEPLVRWNFGEGHWFDVKVKPLLQSKMAQMQQQQQPTPNPGQPPGQPGAAAAGDEQGQGFTGTKQDARGRTYHWQNGHRVSGQLQFATEEGSPLHWGELVTKEIPHVRIVGGTGTGKTTVAQALAQKADGKLFVIDPLWTPGSWGGLPAATVDAEGSYGPIRLAIDGLLDEMKRRGGRLQHGEKDFERLTVLFDEVPDTVFELPDEAGLLIRRLGQRGRHGNIHLVGIGQSDRVGSWGIEGFGDAAENFATVYLGEKAIAAMPETADEEWPAVLEWKGKRHALSLDGVKELAEQPIDPARAFTLSGDVGQKSNFVAELQRQGFDGISGHEGGSPAYAVFKPNQIKSVDNHGAFDPNNDDVRLATTDQPADDPAKANIVNRAAIALEALSALAKQDLADALRKGTLAQQLASARRVVERYKPLLARMLTDAQLAAALAGMRRVATVIPTDPATIQLVPDQPTQEEAAPVTFPTIQEAVTHLAARRLVTPAEYAELEGQAKADAFSVANVETEVVLDKIRGALTEAVAKGEDFGDFQAKVEADLAPGTFLSPAHTETVFRAAVHGSYSVGQDKVLSHPVVGHLFPYAEVFATHDDRARPEHLAMEQHGIQGTSIYRRDDPVFQKFKGPWDYGCRCFWTAISVDEAARRGIHEAIDYQRTGVWPEAKAWVTPPPFEPSPSWRREGDLLMSLQEAGIVLATKDEGRWVTIGGKKDDDGKRKGGSPVFIQNGRITKGHPSLTGKKIAALKEEGDDPSTHRQQVNQFKGHARAVWGKKARKEGIDPASLHQLAAEVLGHNRGHVADHNRMLAEARKALSVYGGQWKTLKQHADKTGGDADRIKGMDKAAQEISRQYPEAFGEHDTPSERLYELLAEGNREPMSEEDAYEQSFEHLMEMKARHRVQDVPFEGQFSTAELPDHRALAEFYADLWNLFAQAKQPIPERELHQVGEELAGGDWVLRHDADADRWEVVHADEHHKAGLEMAVAHAPRGGVSIAGKEYRGGQFIPKSQLEKATPEVQEAVKAASQPGAEKRRARGSVDAAKLSERVRPHADTELSERASVSAKRSYNALRAHHGDLLLHRLEELIGDVEAAHAAVKDNPEQEGVAQQFRERLKAYGQMVEWAQGHGITGEVKAKYGPNVSESDIPYSAAYNAHRGTSFVPETRAKQRQKDFVDTMTHDWESLAEKADTEEKQAQLQEEFDRYKQGYKEKYLDYLHANSRVMSAMIVGPAKFPTAANEKKSDIAHKRLTELLEYRKKALEVIRRKLTPELQPIKSADSDAVERYRQKLSAHEALQEKMKAVNDAHKKFLKDPSSLEASGLTDADKEKIRNYKPAYSWEPHPYPPYALTNNNKEIRRIKARIEEVSAMQASEHKEEQYGDVKVVENPDAGRIQVVFPGKPDEKTRELLKQSGFRWAPSEGAWQRHLNNGGRYAVERVMKQLGKEKTVASPTEEEDKGPSIEPVEIEPAAAPDSEPAGVAEPAVEATGQGVREKDLSDHAAALQSIPVGELHTVAGFKVRRTGDNEYRVETQTGTGNVHGDAAKILDHIQRQQTSDKMYGKLRTEALARAAAHNEPSFLEADRVDEATRAFAGLPAGTPVVSLEEGTHGRTGKIVKDDMGRNRVKLDGEDGYASNFVEPLEAKHSWRVSAEDRQQREAAQANEPQQGGLFEQPEATASAPSEGQPPPVSDDMESRRLELEKQAAELDMITPRVLHPDHHAELEGLKADREKRILKPKEQARLAALEMARRMTPDEAKAAVSRAYALGQKVDAGNASDDDRENLEDLKSKLGTGDASVAYAALEHLPGIHQQSRKAGEQTASATPTAPTGKGQSFKGTTEAADELQAVRNELAGSDPDHAGLKARVDAVGQWAAAQKKQTPMLRKVLEEAHSLADRLEGGSGKGGVRIDISENAPLDLEPARSNTSASGGEDADSPLELVEPGTGIQPEKEHRPFVLPDPTPRQREPVTAKEAQLHDRIRDAALALTGGQEARRVRLVDLRKQLADVPSDEVTKALRYLSRHGDLTLYPHDDPRQIKPEDEVAAVESSTGVPQHILYYGGNSSGAKPTSTPEDVETKSPSPAGNDDLELLPREESPTATEETHAGQPSDERPARSPDAGTPGSGSTGGDAGRAGAEPAPTPRIITARQQFTKAHDPALVPEGVRQHLNEMQQQGAALAIDAIEKHGGFLLADGTGTGKTRQQLAVAKHFLDKGKKVVVVAPAEVIKPDWKKGTISGSWANDAGAMGIPATLVKGDAGVKPGSVHLTTYNELGKLKDHIDKDTVLLFDESHFMKNHDSARHKHGKEAIEKAAGVLYATATPADKPLHIAHLARAGVFGNVGSTKTYEKLGMKLVDQHIGGGRYRKVWQIDPKVGYKEATRRLAGLFDQMTKDGLMVKRELSMHGVGFQTDHATLTTEQHDEIQKVYDDVLAKTDGNKAVALMAARLHQEPMKIPQTVAMAQEELAAGRSPVIFVGRVNDIGEEGEGEDGDKDVRSHGTAAALKKALIAAGIPESDIGELHGGATKTADQKKRAMNDFQANKKKVMIATIQSGGTGINLDDTTGERPRTMIMVTPPFTANDMAQAVGRVHRLNTKSAARIRGVLSDSAIDDWNAKVLASKFQTMGAVVGGETLRGQEAIRPEGMPDVDTESSEPFDWGESLQHVPKHYHNTPYAHNDLIGQFGGRRTNRGGDWTTEFPSKEHFERYREHVAKQEDERARARAAEQAKTPPRPAEVVTDAAPEKPAYMSAERKAAIHDALRQLAANDTDRARERNQVGFNQMDSEFGSQLAGQGSLTDKQAHAAAKMLSKYHRQLDADLHKKVTTQEEEPVKPASKPSAPEASPTHYFVSGNTFDNKEEIKRAGGRWNSDRKGWVVPASAKGRLERLRGLRFAPHSGMQFATENEDDPSPELLLSTVLGFNPLRSPAASLRHAVEVLGRPDAEVRRVLGAIVEREQRQQSGTEADVSDRWRVGRLLVRLGLS